ncbi:UDP-N-acetylmuramoyl-L-alanine--D-glutamate ligase [Fusobacterium sp. PH5-44]|uniref:UDP-N-acetylmuramoyl-L-alanine--D-glutamate ligase n=1 Tax=unclassified Fusobacterium TaxID=2648384 RepID=UPI003D2237ED
MKKVMVFGAGLSGIGALKLLEKENYEVILVDDNSGLSSSEAISQLDNIDFFVKSPGTPYNDLVLKAKEKNIKIIDEIQLAYDYMKNHNYKSQIIAITGTNGKTTVTTKLTELLVFSGLKAKYAGNIGVSLGELVLENNNLDYIVLELSSFQLENLTNFCPDISLVVNLTPDHLERYQSLEDYYLTKFNICKNQNNNHIFILNNDSIQINSFVEKLDIKSRIKIVSISKKNRDSDYFITNGILKNKNEEILSCDKLTLKGSHNLENILFIVSVAKILNISNEKIRDFLYKTKTIEHRMENFYQYQKITFINDSKGTNIDSSRYAIEAFKNCILICGGHDKKSDWTPLVDIIANNVKEVYLIGEIAKTLEKLLINKNFPKNNIHMLNDIKSSLTYMKSHLDPNLEQVILLSPATSSYDQFKNFVERGKIFKNLVREIFI